MTRHTRGGIQLVNPVRNDRRRSFVSPTIGALGQGFSPKGWIAG